MPNFIFSFMTYESITATFGDELLYAALFEAISGNSVLLKNDERFTILAATPAYVEQSGYTHEYLIGKGLFEAFPTSNDPNDTGETKMQASLKAVAETKEPQYLPVQRYDLKNSDGNFTERYWRASNKPVFSPNGEVPYIIHTAEYITSQVLEGKIKEKLKGIEQAYNIFLQAPFVIGILRGRNHVLELVNEEGLRFWNKTDRIIGKPLLEAIPELKGQAVYEKMDQVFHTGKLYQESAVPITSIKEGIEIIRYFDLFYKPFYDESSSVVSGVFTISNEVTEKVLAQQKLKENEDVLQQRVADRTKELEQQKRLITSILEASMDGVYALKAIRNSEGLITDFYYLFANRNTAEVLNLGVNEIIGMSMLTLLPENRNNGFFELFCKLLENGETFKDETHFITQNIDRWYRYVIVPLDKDTVVVSTEDITEKKQAYLQIEEQRNLLDSILKNSSNGISVSQVFRDTNGDVIDALTILANDAAIKYIGLPKEVYLSKRATEIEPNIISSPYYQQCIHTLQTGEAFVTQYQMESNGRWLELTVSKLNEDHLIHVFSDVTPIKQAQLQLEQSVEDLKRSNENLEEFAYAASHDLKEPTRKIHFFAERLKDSLGEKLTPGEKSYFERMESATLRMNTLIDDLLSYSQVSQKVTLEETVDLNELMGQVLTDLDLEIEQKGATINILNLFTIKGHRRQLQQAFQNLISNSLKYSKPDVPPVISIEFAKVKGVDLGLQFAADEQNKDYYKLIINDNGIGFDQADAERIFNIFTRLHGMTEYKGTGVGLSIVRKVIENHCGYIWAESREGQGARFIMLLPC